MFDPDTCRFRKRRPEHVCRDAFGDVIPEGSERVCFAEARMQLLEMELAKSLVDDAYTEADETLVDKIAAASNVVPFPKKRRAS